jgi:hypothetical protein
VTGAGTLTGVTEQQAPDAPDLHERFDRQRAVWRSAGQGGRVQVAFVNDLVGMRDGHDPDSPVLVFTEAEWDAFSAGARAGEFDVADE